MQDRKYTYWFCQIKHLRQTARDALWNWKKSAEAIYNMEEKELNDVAFLPEEQKKIWKRAKEDREWEKQWDNIVAGKIGVITCYDDEYPEKLRHIYKPPRILFVKGKFPEENKLTIGIVGARNCTPYGRDMARMFSYRLAEGGVQIVSGMAKGIDGWSHQGALEAGADTYAVLGTGVEVCYPPSHQALYESIVRHGGVISEFPIHTQAKPQFFPLRNRIISGLSDGILVVEAKEKSGSLITADAALEQGKDVFAVPGRIGDVLSEGCNRLIRQGAVPVLSPRDILDYYNMEAPQKEVGCSEAEREFLAYMQVEPVHIDRIAAKIKKSQTEVLKTALILRRKGEIEEVGRGYYRKKL